MIRALVFIFVLFVVILAVVLGLRRGSRRFPWYEFLSRGRREGFSFREIRFLRRIAEQNRLEKPQSIFWSTRQLDRCLRPALERIRASEGMPPEDKQRMVRKLLELRKKAEFNLPKYQKRIHQTSALLPRQKLVIKDKDYGNFLSWVVENNRKYLVVSQPSGQKASQNLQWAGRKVEVHFWREEDAGYAFESKVMEQIPHEEYPLLYLQHSGKLERVQKRESIRVETSFRGRFYPVYRRSAEGGTRAAVSRQGHSCKIIDLSETGLAMVAGRGMKKNDRYKIEFDLTRVKRIVALCMVVNLSRTSDERVRRYHCMFIKIGTEARNNIQLYVYNIYGERDEEEEAKKPAAPPPAGPNPAPTQNLAQKSSA